MNFQDVHRIMDSGLSGAEQGVMLALYSYVGKDNVPVVWPSIKTLCRRAGFKRGTVFAALAVLDDLGCVVRDNESRKTTCYTLNLGDLPADSWTRPIRRPPVQSADPPSTDRTVQSVDPIVQSVDPIVQSVDPGQSNPRTQKEKGEGERKDPEKEKGLTPRKGWTWFNDIHKRFDSDRIALTYSRYSDDWRKCIAKAGSVEALLLAWECFLFGPDDWHRVNLKTGAKLVAAFLRPTKLSQKLTAADEWVANGKRTTAATTATEEPEYERYETLGAKLRREKREAAEAQNPEAP